jgi:hypothetical protein
MKEVSAVLVVAAVFIGSVLLVPASGVPAGEKMDMEKMISLAKNPTDS